MKNLSKLILLAMVAVLLTNCKKDDPVNASPVGTWKMTDINCNDGRTSFELLGTPVTTTYSFHGTEYNTTTTFTENPNEFTSTGSYKFEITTVFLGQSDTQTTEVDAFAGTGEWSINGDILTQIFAGDTTEVKILELSGSKMRLRQDIDAVVNDAGTEIHDQATVFTTFEKQ